MPNVWNKLAILWLWNFLSNEHSVKLFAFCLILQNSARNYEQLRRAFFLIVKWLWIWNQHHSLYYLIRTARLSHKCTTQAANVERTEAKPLANSRHWLALTLLRLPSLFRLPSTDFIYAVRLNILDSKLTSLRKIISKPALQSYANIQYISHFANRRILTFPWEYFKLNLCFLLFLYNLRNSQSWSFCLWRERNLFLMKSPVSGHPTVLINIVSIHALGVIHRSSNYCVKQHTCGVVSYARSVMCSCLILYRFWSAVC